MGRRITKELVNQVEALIASGASDRQIIKALRLTGIIVMNIRAGVHSLQIGDGRPKRITNETCDQVVQLYRQGSGTVEIMRAAGITYNVARDIARGIHPLQQERKRAQHCHRARRLELAMAPRPHDGWCPTLEEIAAAAAKIRATWDPAEYRDRGRTWWEPPVFVLDRSRR